MRVLITGGGGFLGVKLAKALAAKGEIRGRAITHLAQADLTGWLAHYGMVLFRVTGLFLFLPIFGSKLLTARHRFALALLCLSTTTLWITSVMGMIIDTLHWRHYFIAAGLCFFF